MWYFNMIVSCKVEMIIYIYLDFFISIDSVKFYKDVDIQKIETYLLAWSKIWYNYKYVRIIEMRLFSTVVAKMYILNINQKSRYSKIMFLWFSTYEDNF